MSKTAKRVAPARARIKARPPRERAAPAARAAAHPAAPGTVPVATSVAGVVEGHVVGVDAPGKVRALVAGGDAIQALCPAHVDAAWLAEACGRAPVPALFVTVLPSRRLVLWGLLPGPEHADVRADVVIRGRQIKLDAEAVQLRARDAYLELETNGNVTLKGRDVTSHARRVNRVKGGSVRLN